MSLAVGGANVSTWVCVVHIPYRGTHRHPIAWAHPLHLCFYSLLSVAQREFQGATCLWEKVGHGLGNCKG